MMLSDQVHVSLSQEINMITSFFLYGKCKKILHYLQTQHLILHYDSICIDLLHSIVLGQMLNNFSKTLQPVAVV